MKKTLYAIATVAVLFALTSCGSSSPEDLAKKKVALRTKELNNEAEKYEKAVELNDKDFVKNVQKAASELRKNDEELKEIDKKYDAAEEAYDQVMRGQ